MLTDREQKIVNWLRTRKVATMRHLQHQFQVCHMTVFRALKKFGYHTSYNHNAGYYTLAGVPQFDDWGLWAYRDVRFSRWDAAWRPSWPWSSRPRPDSPPASWRNACRPRWRICWPAWCSTAVCSVSRDGPPRGVLGGRDAERAVSSGSNGNNNSGGGREDRRRDCPPGARPRWSLRCFGR